MNKKTIYRIETLDGCVVRKRATRAYRIGHIKRDKDNKVIGYWGFSIDPNKKPNLRFLSEGYKIEQLRAIEL